MQIIVCWTASIQPLMKYVQTLNFRAHKLGPLRDDRQRGAIILIHQKCFCISNTIIFPGQIEPDHFCTVIGALLYTRQQLTLFRWQDRREREHWALSLSQLLSMAAAQSHQSDDDWFIWSELACFCHCALGHCSRRPCRPRCRFVFIRFNAKSHSRWGAVVTMW